MKYITLLIISWLLVIACQTKKEGAVGDTTTISPDSTDTSAVSYKEDSSEIEHIISFAEFHEKFIPSKVIQPVTLPFRSADESSSPPFTLLSPEGAFENIPKKNGSVNLLGYLPDTTNYFGIIYQLNETGLTTGIPSDWYSTRLVTFGRDGKLIAKSTLIRIRDGEGASSCGKADNQLYGYIDTDLTFFGIYVMTQNCESDGIRPLQSVELTIGQIEKDGSITSKTPGIYDPGGDPPTYSIAECTKPDQPLPTLEHLKNNIALTTPELAYFFSSGDLMNSPAFVWFTLPQPKSAEGRLYLVTRRMVFDDRDVRKSQYGLVYATETSISDPVNFYATEPAIVDSSFPSVEILHDLFVFISHEVPEGKLSNEFTTWRIIKDGNLVSASTLSKEELRIHRNWIFARYGFKFSSPELTSYFSKYNWYKPTSTNVDAKLTYKDKAIISELSKLEKQ